MRLLALVPAAGFGVGAGLAAVAVVCLTGAGAACLTGVVVVVAFCGTVVAGLAGVCWGAAAGVCLTGGGAVFVCLAACSFNFKSSNRIDSTSLQ